MNKELLVRHSTAFTVHPDRAPMFPSHTHQIAVDRLIARLRLGKRLQYLSGEPGSGKTTVLLHFMKTVHSLKSIYVGHTDNGDTVSSVLSELGLATPGDDDLDREALFQSMRAQIAARDNPILMLDNVENLPIEDLKGLDLLSKKLSLPVILAGNCDFASLAWDFDTDKSAVSERICQLDCLSVEEVIEYIHSRLEYSGLDETFFSTEAIQRVYHYSEGNPRRVNLICNNAIILAGLRDLNRVMPDLVEEVVRNRRASGAFTVVKETHADDVQNVVSGDEHDRDTSWSSNSSTKSEYAPLAVGNATREDPGFPVAMERVTDTDIATLPRFGTVAADSTGGWRSGWFGFGLVTGVAVMFALTNPPDIGGLRTSWAEPYAASAQRMTGDDSVVAAPSPTMENPDAADSLDAGSTATSAMLASPVTQALWLPAVDPVPSPAKDRPAELAAWEMQIQKPSTPLQSLKNENEARSKATAEDAPPSGRIHPHEAETRSEPGARSDSRPRTTPQLQKTGSNSTTDASQAVTETRQASIAEAETTTVAEARGAGETDLPPVIERGTRARPVDRLTSE